MKSNVKLTLAECTPEIIKQWKAEHMGLFRYKAADGKTGYFRNPDISEIEAASALVQQSKPLQSNKLLAKACFMGGDECIITQPEYLLGLGKKLQSIVVTVEGELEEL